MRGTTLAPSPVAEATRFMDPDRMSPTAKTPGADVASVSGGTGPPQASHGIERPVRMKP